ncbi:hypothetical protein HJB56_23900 [Rhizobium lentis]|uniref:hypothetical protein n=1 Tax=Rhizobium lentis TaxID=1138194 RepID=UPI001C839F95|nr:hypothetical protein [Rhizobium lentis]MBX5085780.1 hypothetical protein [Rhizobium lentis]MBX5095497.1 hypothetical protein [Rhizobium lentis]MBX5120482.1 hypothetical protein [Rhizobium lentis]MBX5129628.1 hypothetical protein [Rhizobium lentis]
MPMLKDETGEYLIENLPKNGVMAEAIQVHARGGLGVKGLQNEAFEVGRTLSLRAASAIRACENLCSAVPHRLC